MTPATAKEIFAAVLYKHVFRNALIPLVTVIALSLPNLLGGTVIIEQIFAWPGMGKTMFDAIQANDYNLALIGLLFALYLIFLDPKTKQLFSKPDEPVTTRPVI